MAIDLQSEAIIPLRDVPRKTCFKVHVSSLHRWRLRGVRGIRLETALLGGTRVTSLEALERFSRRLSNQDEPGGGREVPVNARRRQIADSESLLDRAGIS